MNIIYKAKRIGKGGKVFNMYKIRTMVMDADQMGQPSVGQDDPRITKIGKFLRRWKIDEIPQLWNVIKRDMNLVGPRPEEESVMKIMREKYPFDYRIITGIRPGLTDLASLWDYNEDERLKDKINPHEYYLDEIWPIKRELQVKYILNRSFWLDIKIIFLTLWQISAIKSFIRIIRKADNLSI